MNWLVLSTFVAGASWGPQVQVIATPDGKTCQTLGAQILEDTRSQARSNLIGVLERVDEDDAMLLRRGTREVVRIRCVKST